MDSEEGSRRISSGAEENASGSPANLPPGPTQGTVTTQWATIEGHFRKHDENAIKKYDNDMDTLLVFAGLYSAVLTGFIIEFYKLLQKDNTDVTVSLLSKISAQLDNSSASSIPDPSKASFHPTSVSTWVNLLWFLSLFMSLAAALFAMVAKQWLREYLTWTSLSADPSEVVVLRQLRAEAWETWQVPFIIGAIPAFLELAVILFLCGMVVLLWTLDPIIAIVLTVFMAIFLAVVFALMVLPAVRRACPYKSPVGWACVWLRNKLLKLLPGDDTWEVHRRAQLAAKTWSRRDLYSVTGVPRYATRATADEKAEYAAKVLVPMVRALSWVKKDSEDTFVLASVDSCIKSMHETSDKLISPSSAARRDPTHVMLHRLKSALFATCKLLDLNDTELRHALSTAFVVVRPSSVGLSGYEDWQECVYRRKSTTLADLIRPATTDTVNSSTEEEIKIAYRILLSAMEHAVPHMFSRRPALAQSVAPHMPSTPVAPLTPSLGPGGDAGYPAYPSANSRARFSAAPQSPRSMVAPPPPMMPNSPTRTILAASPECQKAFVEMFCLIEAIVTLRLPDTGSRKAEDFVECVTRIYRHLYENADLDGQYLGLRTLMFQTLCRFGHHERVIIGLLTNEMISGRLLDRERHPEEISGSQNRYAIVAIRLYRGNWEYLHRHEDRHLFVIAADMAFQTCDHMLNMNYLVDLLNIACQAAQTCLNNKWMNCGCYYDLPWVDTFLQKLKQHRIMHFPWLYLSRLLDCLDDAFDKELLTGDGVLDKLDALRALCSPGDDSVKGGTSPMVVPSMETSTDPPEEVLETLNRLREQSVVPGEAHIHVRSLSSGSDKSAATIPDSTILSGDYIPPQLRNRMSIASVATIDYPVNGPNVLAPHERLFPAALPAHEDPTPTAVEPPSPASTASSSFRGSIIGRLRSGSDPRFSPVSPSSASDYFALTPTTPSPTLNSPTLWEGGRRRSQSFRYDPSRLSMGIASSVPPTIPETIPLTVQTGAQPALPSLPAQFLSTRHSPSFQLDTAQHSENDLDQTTPHHTTLTPNADGLHDITDHANDQPRSPSPDAPA